MAIKFYNIRSKEVRVARTEPQIAALFNSSDRGKNAQEGQDFGWRLAPEVVVEVRRIKADLRLKDRIAARYNLSTSDVDETQILRYISEEVDAKDAPVAREGDYTDEYQQEIRDLEAKSKGKKA